MSSDRRRTLGDAGERLAERHLVHLGYEIVARNHRTRYGELDIIAADTDTLVFCEVKTRRRPGTPFQSLHDRKQQRVRRMAAAYLAQEPDRPRRSTIRFDAIGVVLDADGRLAALEHIEGAF